MRNSSFRLFRWTPLNSMNCGVRSHDALHSAQNSRAGFFCSMVSGEAIVAELTGPCEILISDVKQ